MITNDVADPQEILAVAVAYHNRGQLREALVLYQQLLERFPAHQQLLAVAGQIELQIGRAEDAVSYLTRAVVAATDSSPWQPQWLLDLGAALHMQGQSEEAVRTFSLLIDSGHRSVDAYYNRGTVLLHMKHAEAAVADFDRALALNAGHTGSLINRAVALSSLGRQEDTAEGYARAAVCLPDDADIHYMLGNAMLAVSRLPEALAAFSRTLALAPGHGEASNNYGIVLRRLGRGPEALAAFGAAIRANPRNVPAHVNCGTALMELQRYEEALAAFDEALRIDPALAELHNHRGTALRHLGREAGALAAYARALALKPDFAEAHANCALLALAQGRPEAAVAEFDEAIRYAPSVAEYYTNRGLALQALNLSEPAYESFVRACELEPQNPELQWNLAVQELTMGRYRDGWARYECRWQRDAFATERQDYPMPLWTGGQSLAGQRLLIHAEQGLGDAVQFCRYVAPVVAKGASVIVEAPATLLPLLKSLAGVSALVPAGDPLPAADLHCPMMSLPHLLGPEIADIPSAPYLAADPARVAHWQSALGEKKRPRFGLVVSGRAGHANDHNRSLPLSACSGLLALPFDFHLLQCGVRTSDEAFLAATPALRDHRRALSDMGETAALAACLDGVICVDTSVAHVAGAIGCPLYLLLPFAADWRWMAEGAQSPWYPTAKLCRQPRGGDWAGVLDGLAQDLQAAFPAVGV